MGRRTETPQQAVESGRLRRSSGREPWVFRARQPDELLGRHAGLIASELAPDDALHYVLYSPIFDAECGLFGIRGTPASHGVAVTQDRFVISRDSHRPDTAPTTESISFAHVVAVDLGGALVLSWLAIWYADGAAIRSSTVLFGGSGRHHFEAVVRVFRRLTSPAVVDSRPPLSCNGMWRSAPAYLADAIAPLLLEDEEISCCARWEETWRSSRRGWRAVPVCTSSPGLICTSQAGVLLALSESRLRPNLLSFGVNLVSVPWGALGTVSLDSGEPTASLRLGLMRNGASRWLDVPVDERSASQVGQVVRWIGARA
jgi:hypothetical protein